MMMRKYPLMMGLTGSIGMGKSTVLAMMRQRGIPVFDADATVHHLMRYNKQIKGAIAGAFPTCIVANQVDRGLLGNIVFADHKQKKRLEAIIHPAVARARAQWLRRHARAPVVVCDIPLLFELGLHKKFDGVVVVSAPDFLQHQRVMRRENMTPERFDAIKKAQWPDAQKRCHANVVVKTGGSLGATRRQVAAFLASVLPQKSDLS